MARVGAVASPAGGGTRLTIASISSRTPSPVLPETNNTSSSRHPSTRVSSSAIFSGCAAGKSILLMTGTISRSASIAR